MKTRYSKGEITLFLMAVILSILLLLITFLRYRHLESQKREDTQSMGKSNREPVILYSSLQENQLEVLKREFEKAYPAYTLTFLSMGTGNLVEKLASNRQGSGNFADLVWMGNPHMYTDLKERGILAEYWSPEAKDLAQSLQDKDWYYTVARLALMGILYNSECISPLDVPRTLSAFSHADGALIADPSTSGTTLYSVGALSKAYGWEYFERLKSHQARVVCGSAAVGYEVAKGKAKYALSPEHVYDTIKRLGYPVEFIIPEGVKIVIKSPIAILRNCQNRKGAEALYDFILSDHMQDVFSRFDVVSVRSDRAQKLLGESINDEGWDTDDELKRRFDEVFFADEKKDR